MRRERYSSLSGTLNYLVLRNWTSIWARTGYHSRGQDVEALVFNWFRSARNEWELQRDIDRVTNPGTIGLTWIVAVGIAFRCAGLVIATALSPLEGLFLMLALGITYHTFGWPDKGLGYGAAVGLCAAADVLAVGLLSRPSVSTKTTGS